MRRNLGGGRVPEGTVESVGGELNRWMKWNFGLGGAVGIIRLTTARVREEGRSLTGRPRCLSSRHPCLSRATSIPLRGS
jgi:hypothetical protein